MKKTYDYQSVKVVFIKRFSELTKGQTIKEIAEQIGFSPYAVRLWNCGEMPYVHQLPQIADAYNVTIDYLLGRTEEKEPAQAEAGQAHKEISNTNNIAQSEKVVKNFTNFPPILLDFAHQYFGDINVQHIYAHDDVNADCRSVDIEFVGGDGDRYRILLESVETGEGQP